MNTDPGGGAMRHESGNTAAADWLCLAAAPTFAVMALLTGVLGGVLGGGQMTMVCSTAPDASPLNGMAAMYLLMSAFHLAPWLKLCGRAFRLANDRCGRRATPLAAPEYDRCRGLGPRPPS
jgi:hypothetical protein